MKKYSLALVRWISGLLIFGGLGGALMGALFSVQWPMYAGTAAALAGVVVQALFYRCPGCGKPLNPRNAKTGACPYCGESLKGK